MFKYFKFMLVLVLVIGIAPNWAMAQGHSHSDAVTSATPKLGHNEVVVTGKVICLGCHLKKEKGARAQCSLYGHTNAISIEKIYDAQGNRINEAKGKIYQFLHNDQSDKLITDHGFAGKTMVVVGKIYPEANIIEVNFYKEKEEKR